MIANDVRRRARERGHSQPVTSDVVQAAGEQVMVSDVLFDAAEVLHHLRTASAAGDLVDTFLLLVALGQILEDHASEPVRLWREARNQIERAFAGEGAPLVVLDQFDRAGRLLRELWRHRLEDSLSEKIRKAIDACATAVLSEENAELDPGIADAVSGLIEAVTATSPRFLTDLVRVPSSFRSFDQRPEDLVRLVESYCATRDIGGAALAVVGLRTSGSYLAPLVAASLAKSRPAFCTWVTARPGWPLSYCAARVIEKVAREHNGRIVIVDDPPGSGRSLVVAAKMLARTARISLSRIDLLLASFGETLELPSELRQSALVHLPVSKWSFQEHLSLCYVQRMLEQVLGEGAVEVTALGPVSVVAREHLSRRFRVRIADPNGFAPRELEVVARGLGFGYYGRSLLATRAADPLLYAPVLAASDELVVYVDEPKLSPGGLVEDEVSQVAAHLARRAGFRVPAKAARALAGRQSEWEVASRLVSGSFGRLCLPARFCGVDHVVQRLLECGAPSLVQGPEAQMDWRVGDDGVARRAFPGEGPSSHLDLSSYDPVFDLAAAAQWSGDMAIASSLRRRYEELTGTEVDAERWFLHRLVQLYHQRRIDAVSDQELRRGCARLAQEYFAERFLADIALPEDGPICALDLDGVLETSVLGFPATTRSGALGLRALRAHGMRLVLVSGRSQSEVVERCSSYGALGGVAEYGAAHVLFGTAPVQCATVTPQIEQALGAVRARAIEAGFVVDSDYQLVARVFEWRNGKRVGLQGPALGRLCDSSMLRIVRGEEQSDFVPVNSTKAAGLESLLALLEEREANPPRLVFGIGDSEEDAGFLARCERAYAPKNSKRVLWYSTSRTKKPYQSGFGEAVGNLLGHAPGSCRTCAPAKLSKDQDGLLDVLSAQESGPLGGLFGLLRLARRRLGP